MQRNKIYTTGLLTCIIAINLFAQGPPENKGYELLYENNFDTDTLNTDEWIYREGRRTGGGYINGLNLRENVYLKNGTLHIIAKHEIVDGQYENTGGGIISKLNFGYGYYECLSKPYMAGKGVHTSFWQAGSLRKNNNIFEIDSYEIDSKSKMGSNNLYIHLRTKDARVPWVHRLQVPYVADEMGWVLDAYEYTPDGVIFYDDGKIVGKAEWKNLTAQQAVWLTALNGCGEVDTTALPGESLFKYFRYYAKDYPGINLLPNGNFEYNQDAKNPEYPVAWTTSEGNGSIKVIKANAAKDLYKLRISSEKSFRVLLQQKLEFIRNGEYILTAKVRANCTTGNAKIKVNGEDNEMLIPNSEHWKSLVLKDIIISNNEACISIEIDGDANEWIEVDDVKFMKPAVKHVKVTDNEPFTLIKDPVWQLAEEDPVIFTGNDKFFFFDRFVGFGDAISVAFTLTVNQMNNMTPIARIPKTGKSGWAIALAKDGSLVFRIGSMENHTDVVARNGYMVDKPCKIVCQFNKGTASVYLDGRLLTEFKGIPQNTLDETAAGKLGSIGNGYEAINGVVQDTDGNITEISKSNNFKGELQQVKIYNRAIY